MIGLLDRLMTLQERAATPDGGGGFAGGWEDVAEVYAGVLSTQASEESGPGGTRPIVTATLILRRRDDLSPGMRLQDGAKAYYIQSAALEKDGDYARVTARLEA